MDISQFHFLRPQWWLAVIPLALLLWVHARRSTGVGPWGRIVDPQLLPHVVEGPYASARPWRLVALAIGGVVAIAALAGPTWSRLPQPVYRTADGLVIALDLSRSMEATDLAPNRLKRTQFKIADILAARKEGQTALIVYAGKPFVVTPLTDDTATIGTQLPALDPELMPSRGSRTDLAIAKAAELLHQAGLRQGRVLLITDGTELQRSEQAARDLLQEGYHLDVLGVGTPEGAPIPLKGGGFLYTTDGSIVVPKLDPDPLSRLARAGGGRYHSITTDDSDLLSLLPPGSHPDLDRARKAADVTTDRWRDEGAWWLLPLLPLAALAFRRGWLFMLIILMVTPLPRPAHALDWAGIWARPDQRASKALEAGDAARAAELFRDPAWRGAAQYRAGDYAGTTHTLESLDDAQSWYNRGNALARMEEYHRAIQAYDEALKRDTAMEDARHNRELVQQQLSSRENAAQPDGQQGDEGAQEAPQQEQQRGGQPPGGPGHPRNDNPGQAGSDLDRQGEGPPPEQGRGNPTTRPSPEDGRQEASHTPAESGSAEKPPGGGDPPSGAKAEADATPEQTDSRLPGEHSSTDPRAGQARGKDEGPDEAEQALTQWLRRIPDDPGGLLRRKFLYQYRSQSQAPTNDTHPW